MYSHPGGQRVSRLTRMTYIHTYSIREYVFGIRQDTPGYCILIRYIRIPVHQDASGYCIERPAPNLRPTPPALDGELAMEDHGRERERLVSDAEGVET